MFFGNAGVLPSGDDVRAVIVGDVVGAFGVGLPLAVVLGLHTPLGLAGVFVARGVKETGQTSRLPVALRLTRLDWHTIAHYEPAATP